MSNTPGCSKGKMKYMMKLSYKNPIKDPTSLHHLDWLLQDKSGVVESWCKRIISDDWADSQQWNHLREVLIVASEVLKE